MGRTDDWCSFWRTIRISVQRHIIPVCYEQSFQGINLIAKKAIKNKTQTEATFEFEGTGFVVRGEARKPAQNKADYTFVAALYIDGEKVETASFSTRFATKRLELFWKYGIDKKKHTVTIKVLNPSPDYTLQFSDYIFY